MLKITSRSQMQELMDGMRKAGRKIGFVPTMGFLHEGHLSLVKRARKENDVAVVSIFVNPAQFAPDEDYEHYPRDIKRDEKMLNGITDYLFCPDVAEIYGNDEKIVFKITGITSCLCGRARPHHFQGVVRVVAKLLNIVKPHNIYFGQKDYQQAVVIERLVNDLFFDLRIIICPTVREEDGLAMSSRNGYMSSDERREAVVLHESLLQAKKMLEEGEKSAAAVIGKMQDVVQTRHLARIDYIDICDAETLKKTDKIGNRAVVVALAVYFGKTRLIDNVIFNPRSDASQ